MHHLQTEEPLQRPLLDWLAAYFVEEGWSLKAVHRVIVASSTYRQASGGAAVQESLARDPENHYFARAERRRLDYEATRDALLAVSGELDRAIGGRPEALQGAKPTKRRAVYGFIDRYTLPPMMTRISPSSPTTPT